jgi:hypothetical protein
LCVTLVEWATVDVSSLTAAAVQYLGSTEGKKHKVESKKFKKKTFGILK